MMTLGFGPADNMLHFIPIIPCFSSLGTFQFCVPRLQLKMCPGLGGVPRAVELVTRAGWCPAGGLS